MFSDSYINSDGNFSAVIRLVRILSNSAMLFLICSPYAAPQQECKEWLEILSQRYTKNMQGFWTMQAQSYEATNWELKGPINVSESGSTWQLGEEQFLCTDRGHELWRIERVSGRIRLVSNRSRRKWFRGVPWTFWDFCRFPLGYLDPAWASRCVIKSSESDTLQLYVALNRDSLAYPQNVNLFISQKDSSLSSIRFSEGSQDERSLQILGESIRTPSNKSRSIDSLILTTPHWKGKLRIDFYSKEIHSEEQQAKSR